jgi:hypothetical protein
MKFGLWFLSAGAIGAVSTLLAAALPVPPSLPSITTGVAPAAPTRVAAAPGRSAPVAATLPPAATPIQAAVTPPAALPAPATARPKSVTAGATAARNLAPRHVARTPARRVAKATPDRHRLAVAHTVAPRYGAIVAEPSGPYPGMPVHEPTQLAMAPPPSPYGMPGPYWPGPYPPR